MQDVYWIGNLWKEKWEEEEVSVEKKEVEKEEVREASEGRL